MYDNTKILNAKPSQLITSVKQIVLMLKFDGFLMNIVWNPTNSRDLKGFDGQLQDNGMYISAMMDTLMTIGCTQVGCCELLRLQEL